MALRGDDMDSELDDTERDILAPLIDGPQTLTQTGERRLQDLARRGYVRLTPARCGPLGIRTGETIATLTECGMGVLVELRNQGTQGG